MFKTFIILKYFHIQTSAIKRKYPTLIVRIFLVSARTHSISRYIHIQSLCVHKRNVLRFLQHGTDDVVVRRGSHFCQSPQHPPPPPRKNVPSLSRANLLSYKSCLGERFVSGTRDHINGSSVPLEVKTVRASQLSKPKKIKCGQYLII